LDFHNEDIQKLDITLIITKDKMGRCFQTVGCKHELKPFAVDLSN